MTDFWPAILGKLIAREDLSSPEATDAMRRIMSGEATAAQIAAFVVALRAKGETPREVAGLAAAMLELAPRVEAPGPVVDTCGTGGDRAGTINVSTLAAIVAAGAEPWWPSTGTAPPPPGAAPPTCWRRSASRWPSSPMAFHDVSPNAASGSCSSGLPCRHGSRGRSTQGDGGPHGVQLPGSTDQPSPRRPSAQVVGVSNPAMLPVLAGVLAERGTRAYVFRGSDGLDELTTTGPSTVSETGQGQTREFELDPGTLGLHTASAGCRRGCRAQCRCGPRGPGWTAGSGPRHRAAQCGGGAVRRRPRIGPRGWAPHVGGVGRPRERRGRPGAVGRGVERVKRAATGRPRSPREHGLEVVLEYTWNAIKVSVRATPSPWPRRPG